MQFNSIRYQYKLVRESCYLTGITAVSILQFSKLAKVSKVSDFRFKNSSFRRAIVAIRCCPKCNTDKQFSLNKYR